MIPLPTSPPKRLLDASVLCLGVSAFITQIVLMRELLNVFAGNELVFGIVLGNWMLLTGLGAALGRTAAALSRPVLVLLAAQMLVALLPVVDVYLLRALRNVVFLRGAAVGVTETVLSCAVLMAPYCMVLGYLLPLATHMVRCCKRAEGSAAEAASIGRVYFLDNIGTVLGGVLFTFGLVHFCDHFEALSVPAALNLLMAAAVAWHCGLRPGALLPIGLLATLIGAIGWADLDGRSLRLLYPGQQIVFHGQSPYGNLVVAHSAGQWNFIQSGVVSFSTEQVERVEETVHYAMAQRPEAKSVLLIGGVVSGTVSELLKYPVEELCGVELDPLVVPVARQILPDAVAPLADRRVELVVTDGRLFVKQNKARFDVIIVDMPDPATSQLNRFYTREFFGEARAALKPGGVLCFALGTFDDYLPAEAARVLSAARRTLAEVFQNVLLLPGYRVFFLASDGPLTAEIGPRLQQAGVETRFVRPEYVRSMFAPHRRRSLEMSLAADAPLNTDFNPILYFAHLRYWISQFDVRFGLLEGVLLAALVVYLVRLRAVPLAILAGGFAASGLEVVLLLALQSLYGYLYLQVGLIVTVFMVGLGIGSLAANWYLGYRLSVRSIATWTRQPDANPASCDSFASAASPVSPTSPASPADVAAPVATTDKPPSAGPARKHFLRLLAALSAALAAYAVLLGPVLLALGRLDVNAGPSVFPVIIPLLTLLLALLVGMQFPIAGWLSGPDSITAAPGVGRAAARLYLADYMGAALGALLMSTLLVPLLGAMMACLVCAALNAVATVAVLLTR